MKEITPQDLRQRLARNEKLFLLDVRQPAEFAAGHIDGATLIPLPELGTRLTELPKDATIIVNCHLGGRSAQACTLLAGSGFTDVTNLTGGFKRWDAEK